MSEAVRAVALQNAVTFAKDHGLALEDTLAVAGEFNAFLEADNRKAEAPKAEAPKAEATKAIEAPKGQALKGEAPKRGRPAKVAEASNPQDQFTLGKKPETEDEWSAEALARAEAEENAKEAVPLKEDVVMAVSAALDANKRKEVIALFGKYKASSASGVKESDRAAFIADIKAFLD